MIGLNIKIVSQIEKKFIVNKMPGGSLDKIPKSAIAAVTAAIVVSQERRLFASIDEAIEEHNVNYVASNMLQYQWQMNKSELDARLQQIRDVNPGEWEHVSLAQLWNCVLAGMTFDKNGRLELESLPMYRSLKW